MTILPAPPSAAQASNFAFSSSNFLDRCSKSSLDFLSRSWHQVKNERLYYKPALPYFTLWTVTLIFTTSKELCVPISYKAFQWRSGH